MSNLIRRLEGKNGTRTYSQTVKTRQWIRIVNDNRKTQGTIAQQALDGSGIHMGAEKEEGQELRV